jgi:hypothetical protein
LEAEGGFVLKRVFPFSHRLKPGAKRSRLKTAENTLKSWILFIFQWLECANP